MLQPLLPTDPESNYQVDKELSFSNIAGVIPTADRIRFERMLFRSTRGNCYVRFADIEEALVNTATGTEVSKSVFLILYKSSAIEGKIKRICDAFAAHRFDLPNLDRRRDVENQMQSNQRELEDSKRVLDKNTESRVRLCVELAQSVEEWLWVVRREKAIYHTLNLFKNDAGNFLRGQGWILKDSLVKARAALDHAQSSLNMPTTSVIEKVHDLWPTPPTHFRTNKFTDAYQEFVNTYGIPRYREANPALFTAATFPFLFGVMYGDIGHGSIIALAGAILIATEKYGDSREAGEMLKGLYSARYMLLMMGLMGLYAGLIYNDFFSLGLNLFGTSWDFKVRESGEEAENKGAYGDPDHVYPFGVDPAWHISDNELLFFNSMKMKMSVVLGIIQMTFGVCLRGINSLYFRQYLELFTEFLPMIIFCVGFFGYMIILIFVKWSIDWEARMLLGSCVYTAEGVVGCTLSDANPDCFSSQGNPCNKNTLVDELCPLDYGGTGDGCQPPNLITTLINIALSPGAVDEPMYEGQVGVQTFLLLIAFFCVPWLLLGKPLYIRYFSKKADLHDVDSAQAQNPLLDNVSTHKSEHGDAAPAAGGDHGAHGHGEDFGEIAIHQAIETIEFVLGMVSNTASYLRLWALSLAHSELATVFWEKAMLSMITTNNPVMVYFGYAVFAAVTIAVLLLMDVLECFLHALRLHWVEFQNKFFKADGYRFVPFDFKTVLQRAMLE